MMPNGFGEVAERLRRSTVQIRMPGRWGGAASGVLWSPDGVVVTNAHVTRGLQPTVELWDGRTLTAAVMQRDPQRDLASLRVHGTGLPAATIGDSSTLRIGVLVIAVGNPLGFRGALTTGVVHALGRVPGLGPYSWVQAGVRLAPGNSGGPLADAQGRVVGINTMIASGLGLAVPSNAVTGFLKRGESGALLGVVVRPVPLPVGSPHALGMLVLEVAPEGPAAAASVWPGDILIGAEGRLFRSLDDLAAALDTGTGVVHLQFFRGDRRRVQETAVQVSLRGAEAA